MNKLEFTAKPSDIHTVTSHYLYIFYTQFHMSFLAKQPRNIMQQNFLNFFIFDLDRK